MTLGTLFGIFSLVGLGIALFGMGWIIVLQRSTIRSLNDTIRSHKRTITAQGWIIDAKDRELRTFGMDGTKSRYTPAEDPQQLL